MKVARHTIFFYRLFLEGSLREMGSDKHVDSWGAVRAHDVCSVLQRHEKLGMTGGVPPA
jgi:hypothetical protein